MQLQRSDSDSRLADGRRLAVVVRNARACYDGRTLVPVDVVVERKMDANGCPRFTTTLVDVSERMRASLEAAARREMEKRVMAKAQFLANISHELRTPLNGVLGMTSAMQSTALTTVQRENMTVIDKSARALLSLLDDLLTFAQADSGNLALHYQIFSIQALLDDMEIMLSNALVAAGKDAVSIARVSADLELPPLCVGDSRRIRQVFMNLISNAVKFTERGQIRLAVRVKPAGDGVKLPGAVPCNDAAHLFDSEPDDDDAPATTSEADVPWAAVLPVEIAVTVADSGIGMSSELVKRVFAPFEQADGSIRRKHGGAGLGLVVVKEVTRLCGGDVSVDSAPGLGSAFRATFVFGAVQDTAAQHARVLGDVRPLQEASILVVGANAKRAAWLAQHFQEAPVRATDVVRLADPFDALVEIRDAASFGDPYSLVILDPDETILDAWAVLHSLGRYNPSPLALGTRFIVIGESEAGNAASATESGLKSTVATVASDVGRLRVLQAALAVLDGVPAHAHSVSKKRQRARHRVRHLSYSRELSLGDQSTVSTSQSASATLSRSELDAVISWPSHRSVLDACGDGGLAASVSVVCVSDKVGLVATLAAMGVTQVVTCRSGAQMMLALGRARAQHQLPHLVMIDGSHGSNGLPQLAHTARTALGNPDGITLAAVVDDYDVFGNVDGFDEVLAPPVDRDDLMDAACRALVRAKVAEVEHMLQFSQLPGGKLQVLVVDDIEVNRMVLSALLANMSAEVAEACDGDEMLSQLNADCHAVDLVLLDCHMPVKDGYAAAAELRMLECDGECDRRLPISAVTADTGAEKEALRSGMDLCLFKPISRAAIQAAVALLVERALPRDALNPPTLPPPLRDQIAGAQPSLGDVARADLDVMVAGLVLCGRPRAACALKLSWDVAQESTRSGLIDGLCRLVDDVINE
ncbi:sensor protein [Thecamonas trahens ATCC 50062]|uniref:Sensor protein n=1 Tax=Thecamonas trahens ATCC 50062 TaxID=461836 RepID=A0A0L0DEW5_THETB|nr:sensor protein [Thecamonas trahens ATCC 50062]KNC50765.1 sensor protein [Thecamonas trahens ATCC 50062]|eukprot:XP_013756727.1 sensor protein [Thecamonas trahens ATCC 50062]